MPKQSIKIGLLLVATMLLAYAELYAQTSQRQLKKAIRQNAVLIDVRTAAEFEAGTVHNAINIPLDQLEDSLLHIPRNQPVIIFCKSGNRSGKAITLLQQNGYKNLRNGGGWESLKALYKRAKKE